MLGYGLNINKQISTGYFGPLDRLGNVGNCILGIAPYKRLTKLYDDWLVLVVRVNDLEESYFYPDGNGNIDNAEIITWLAGSNGVVKQVANQTKTSNSAYQNTLTSMPRIVNSGVFDSDGPYYDGNDRLKMDDYAEIQILNPPYSLYANVIGSTVPEAIFSKTLNSHTNAQIYLAHLNADLIWWHEGIEFRDSSKFTVGSSNNIIGTWESKNADGFKIRTNLSEYTKTLNTTLTNQPNINIAALSNTTDNSNAGTYLTGNIKTTLLFNTDEYDKYDDFVTQGL